MHYTETYYQKARHLQQSPRTTKKGRFIIEDYSDCIVKDYNKFIITLKNCDIKQTRLNEEKIKVILNILEIQNKQINLMKEIIEKNTKVDPLFYKTNEIINTLLESVKNKFNK